MIEKVCLLRTFCNILFSSALILNTTPSHTFSDNRVKHFDQAVWPLMKHHDIWNVDVQEEEGEEEQQQQQNKLNLVDGINDLFNKQDMAEESIGETFHSNGLVNHENNSRVIHLKPRHSKVDGECLSNDGRRSGTCYNAYECRAKGGTAKGECAMGFGVCCIFIAACNQTINNNLTYLISPNFPSFMTDNFTDCNWKIKLLDGDISQLRFDFYHFTLGQPNRRNGVCDGDNFRITGGPSKSFTLCGQNNGQHIYYDIGGRVLSRQTHPQPPLYGSLRPLGYDDIYPGYSNGNDTAMDITISLQFVQRYLPSRLWEIQITQIPFSQRAPVGCLQYFTGNEGILQTFNFADNGRHLANQNYRICMRQEMNMCSIVYQPCDEQSFRIGPSFMINPSTSSNSPVMAAAINAGSGGITSSGATAPPLSVNMATPTTSVTSSTMPQVLNDDVSNVSNGMMSSVAPSSTTTQMSVSSSDATTPAASTTPSTMAVTSAVSTAMSSTQSTTAAPSADDPAPPSSTAVNSGSSTVSTVISSTTAIASSSSTSPLSDDVEGSGDNNDDASFRPTPSINNVSRRPRPVGGGFDIFGFLRDAFDFNLRSSSRRQQRQFYSRCTDRLTMPCIIEDFIDGGMGPLPGCEPIHCGMQFCSSGKWPCRIESTVTPFYVGIHFGNGFGKGSAEDNIGACLRYSQVQCI